MILKRAQKYILFSTKAKNEKKEKKDLGYEIWDMRFGI